MRRLIQHMKRFWLVFLLFVVLLIAYWAWPFFGLRSLAVDLQSRDVAALNEQVDFERLRRSFTEQIIGAYLRVTGRANKLGALGSALASAAGGTIADPWVAEIINPENLIELLRGRSVSTDLGATSLNVGELPSLSFRTALSAWLNTEYWLSRFSIGLPIDAPAAEQFRLRLQLLDWRWKLTGIQLPQKLSDQLAQELAKKYP
jgi:Protein of unknown function (DUF2939)